MANTRLINLYRVLRVPEDADDEAIQAAYRRLSKEYHPDNGGNPAMFTALTEAKSILLDHDRRAAFDAALAATRAPAHQPPPPPVQPQVAPQPEVVLPVASYRIRARRLRIAELLLAGALAMAWYAITAADVIGRALPPELAHQKLALRLRTLVGHAQPLHLALAFVAGLAIEQLLGPVLRLWVARPAPVRHAAIVLSVGLALMLPFLTQPAAWFYALVPAAVVFAASSVLAVYRWGRYWFRAP